MRHVSKACIMFFIQFTTLIGHAMTYSGFLLLTLSLPLSLSLFLSLSLSLSLFLSLFVTLLLRLSPKFICLKVVSIQANRAQRVCPVDHAHMMHCVMVN